MDKLKFPSIAACVIVTIVIIYLSGSLDHTAETTSTINQSQNNNAPAPDSGNVATPPTEQAVIDRATAPGFGDMADIKDRRLLRVLVAYSDTNFFFDGPAFMGFDYEIMREYEKYLNKNVTNESKRIVTTFIVKPFAEILDELVAGRGDIAVANLTVTAEREKRVNFTHPYIFNVNEVIVHNKAIGSLNTIEDLSGQTLHLLAGSSHMEHAKKLNVHFKDEKLVPLKLLAAQKNLSSEDILELVNANVYSMTIADDFKARAWESVLPDIIVRDDLVINSGGQIAWAVRKESVDLLESLNGFIDIIREGSLLGNIFFKRYYENSKWIDNPTLPSEISRLDKYKSVMQKYAQEYEFDWLSIAAMAYQESKLDQSKVSPAGAVGIMQIKPDTAGSDPVGIVDISIPENNINAGVKYLAYLRERYFTSPEIALEDRVDFTWAAYNAGPARIASLRELAAEKGYDPNKWFLNVERIAAREIGRETVRYVANVNKYYIAYKLAEENL